MESVGRRFYRKDTHLTTNSKEVLLSGVGKVLVLDNHKELAAYPLDSNHLSGPRGVDGLDNTDESRVYFVADAGSGKVYRYTLREGDQQLRQLWDNFLNAIRTSNFAAARNYIHPDSRQWFDEYIKALGIYAPRIADEFSTGSQLDLRYIQQNVAEFMVFVEADILGNGPEILAAPIRFVRDDSGNWKIAGF